jgi:excisionase family DNA binding protein
MKRPLTFQRQWPTTTTLSRSVVMDDPPILYNGAPLAKCELLARLRNNPPPWFAGLSDDEFRARIEAAIDAARVPSERGKHREKVNFASSESEVDTGDDDDELVEPAPQAAALPSPTDGLKTPKQAARRLGVSIRTLRGLVSSGDLRYVNVGRGKQREKIMFTDNDINDLIAGRTRQKAPQSCPSISPKACLCYTPTH